MTGWSVLVGWAVMVCEDIQGFMFLLHQPLGVVLIWEVEAESHVVSSWEEEKPKTKKTVFLQIKDHLEVAQVTEVGPNLVTCSCDQEGWKIYCLASWPCMQEEE